MPQFKEMLDAVDKVDSADLTIDEIKNPSGWILLGFVMDPRTGLGRFRDYRVSNYQLMEQLMHDCGELPIDEILKLPDVKERLEVYREQSALFEQMLKRCSRTAGSLIISDVRGEETIYAGNRFMIYSLFPEQNVSMWITWGREKQNVAIAVGYSILNKTCQADIGSLMLSYGGGGHKQVGTCQVKTEDAERVIEELAEKLKG
jgi:nanoRNase/pAp phosphatase (c-di-AMP/oligoRNAs hydrolase)